MEHCHRICLKLKTIKKTLDENRITCWYSCAIFIVFFTFYLTLSFLLSRTPAFSEWDILFEFDVPRAIGDISNFSANHWRTNVHPLYVLFVNPLGVLLSFLLSFFGYTFTAAAKIINSFFGAIGVSLAFIFFWLFSKNHINSLILSIGFGLSTSQLIYSTVPETWSLTVCSLITMYILFLLDLRKDNSNYFLWIIIGIFTLGTTTTNFIQTLICFSVILFKDKNKHSYEQIKKLLIYLTIVLASTIVLSLIQKVIYPSSNLFFQPSIYPSEFQYTSLLIFKEPLLVVSQVIKHFFLVNFVAPIPTVFFMANYSNSAITF